MTGFGTYCHINNHTVKVNGKTVFNKQENAEDDWARQIYKYLKIDYPKFYKMDALSKFTILGTEALKANHPEINNYGDDEIALIFSNCNSSADADIQFQNSYVVDKAPSPSLFVYTLPNILIGEVAIRNKWYGENLFFIRKEFDAAFFKSYCDILLAGNTKACLCGWVESLNNETDVFLFFVEQTKTLPLSVETLNNLYKS